LYRGQTGLFSSGVEELFSIALGALTVLSDYLPGMSFENVLDSYATVPSLTEIALLRIVYDKVKDINLKELENISENLCENRSVNMGNEIIKYANAKKAKLVFLTFGMVHTYGIVDTLERSNENYLILLSNSKPL
jgi:hypothetical protein